MRVAFRVKPGQQQLGRSESSLSHRTKRTSDEFVRYLFLTADPCGRLFGPKGECGGAHWQATALPVIDGWKLDGYLPPCVGAPLQASRSEIGTSHNVNGYSARVARAGPLRPSGIFELEGCVSDAATDPGFNRPTEPAQASGRKMCRWGPFLSRDSGRRHFSLTLACLEMCPTQVEGTEGCDVCTLS
jgi:hypothetical protein